MDVTAVVLSPSPIDRTGLGIPDSVRFLNHVSTFSCTDGIAEARRRSIEKVDTSHFFFLDSDDDLPEDAESVLEECAAAGTSLAFTDEVVHRASEAPVRFGCSGYSLEAHALRPLLVHHLALVSTAEARAALLDIPKERVWIEQVLYFEVARRGGATHIPRVGYNWRPSDGLHRAPGLVTAMVRGSSWCYRRLG